ncbi:hypothetical protein VKT23_004751 [Stygiomarasmius scandens]|uniref:Uncharacterized protein n=1 Tax=Marasmiellus scandens TaxID=2682957 RepID=A0ABR1JUY1_9AGAR
MDTIPSGGTFVVFTLDLVASVAHLENQELTTACRELQLSQNKYVAYVRRDRGNLPMPWNRYNAFHFHPVWQGHDNPPFPIKARQVEPDTFFPILPNLHQPASCSEHKPIEPRQPLPWNDCYVSSCVAIGVRCETEWTDSKARLSPYQTTLMEEVRINGQMASDNSKIYTKPRHVQAPILPSGASFVSDLSSTCEVKPMWTDEEPDMLTVRMANLLCGYYAADERVIVQCSTDLSTVDTVNHPNRLFEQLARFYQLKDQLEASRKLRQIEEARKIDDEHYSSYPVPESPAPKPRRRLLSRCGHKLKTIMSFGWSKRLGCMNAKCVYNG